MKNKKITLITCFILLLISCAAICCFLTAFLVWGRGEDHIDYDDIKDQLENNHEDINVTDTNIDLPSIQVQSINNSSINSPIPEQVQVNEILLAKDVFEILEQKDWNGDPDNMPLEVDDFDKSKLENYISNQQEKASKLTIPSELEDTFISTESAKEIRSLMLLAREEYLSYLEAKHVNANYIDEIKNNVLPAEASRIEYVAINDPYAEPTSVGGYNINSDGEKDYSQVNLILYAVDVYNVADNVDNSKILKDSTTDYWKQVRNVAVRQLMYHEMTHVLQRAFVNMNVTEEHKMDKSAYVYADRTLVDVDDQYFWNWGNTTTFKKSNNRQISQESQADGISFEILTNVYDMSKEQKEALWNHLFGRLTNARNALNDIKQTTESNWPNLVVDETSDEIAQIMSEYNGNAEDRKTLRNLATRISGFPAYIGYLNPMQPDDTGAFWSYLEQ